MPSEHDSIRIPVRTQVLQIYFCSPDLPVSCRHRICGRICADEAEFRLRASFDEVFRVEAAARHRAHEAPGPPTDAVAPDAEMEVEDEEAGWKVHAVNMDMDESAGQHPRSRALPACACQSSLHLPHARICAMRARQRSGMRLKSP